MNELLDLIHKVFLDPEYFESEINKTKDSCIYGFKTNGFNDSLRSDISDFTSTLVNFCEYYECRYKKSEISLVFEIKENKNSDFIEYIKKNYKSII